MLGRVGLIRTDVSEEHIASIFRVERITELGMLTVTSILPFLQIIGSYKSHTASHPRKQHSSESPPWEPHIVHSANRMGSAEET
jgi:hypothetical protein